MQFCSLIELIDCKDKLYLLVSHIIIHLIVKMIINFNIFFDTVVYRSFYSIFILEEINVHIET